MVYGTLQRSSSLQTPDTDLLFPFWTISLSSKFEVGFICDIYFLGGFTTHEGTIELLFYAVCVCVECYEIIPMSACIFPNVVLCFYTFRLSE